MDKPSSRDLLSDLPLSMIHCILERVPIRDAIKTSILSSHWRYKWATLPHLVFNDNCVTPSEDDVINETRLINFINQALLLHEGPIHAFNLLTSSLEKCYIDQWLLFLSRKDIRVLILYILNREEGVCINSSLYSCHNLTHLELCRCEIPPHPPTFKGFLCLRRLKLFLQLPSSIIESLVANSSLLEELVLSDSEGLQLRIHAPNLKLFYLFGNYKKISLYAPLLSELDVELHEIDFTAELLQQKSSVCNFTDFLGGFPNLEEFCGGRNFIEYLSVGIESCHDSLVFHHLRKIELNKVDLHDIKETSVVVRLIMGAPALQKLDISVRGLYPNKHSAAEHLQLESSACNYTKFFGSLTNLEELTGDFFFLEFLSVGFKSFHSSLVLHRLRVITLHDVRFHTIEVMPVFAHLIMSAPNLHKLIILNVFFREHSVSFWDSESAPNFTLEQLKVVEMEKVEMKFIKFLLASSPALETMIYRPDPSLTDKQLLHLMAELLTYRRASTNAQILFSNR